MPAEMYALSHDGLRLHWVEDEEWPVRGNHAVVAYVMDTLRAAETINLTPDGPSVPADPMDQLAVYAVANQILGPGTHWIHAPEAKVGSPPDMTAEHPDGRALRWYARTSPHVCGDMELVDEVLRALAAHDAIEVTPTGPSVPADPASQMAVYAVANRILGFKAKWHNPPDTDFGLPEGAIA